MEVQALPKFVKADNKDGLMYSDTYLTDGKFLIKKCYVKESFKYYNHNNTSKRLNDSDMERIINSVADSKFIYKITNRLYDCGNCYQREFFCEEQPVQEEKFIYLNEGYIKHYGIKEVSSRDNFSAVSAFDGLLILMPMRGPDFKIEGKK